MSKIDDVFAALRAWEQSEGSGPFRLVCRVMPGMSSADLESVRRGSIVGQELADLWLTSRESWLFKDVEYGQWGLHILSPQGSAIRTENEKLVRPSDFRSSDVVIGEFLGDTELLVYAPSEEGGRRCLVALPLDGRTDWYPAGSSIAAVLGRLIEAGGDKYWESRRTHSV